MIGETTPDLRRWIAKLANENNCTQNVIDDLDQMDDDEFVQTMRDLLHRLNIILAN